MDQLETTRGRILGRVVAALLMTAATCVLAALASIALADYWWELATDLRTLGLVAVLSAAIIGLVRGWQLLVAPYSLQRAAVDVESYVSEFGQGLRTALDYQEAADRDFSARPAAASPGLIGALHSETYAISQAAPWDEVGPSRWLWQAVLSLLLISGGCLIALAIAPELRTSAGRVLLLPWQYTQVTFEPQQKTVKQGESVLIQATITGRAISAAKLRYELKSKPGEWTTVELLPKDAADQVAGETQVETKLHGSVQTKLTKLTEDVTFEVLAGPLALPTGNIRVLQPLSIKHFEAEITPPAYTKKPATTVETYDLKVWEGSHVAMQIELNRPAAFASLQRIDKDAPKTGSMETPATFEGTLLKIDLNDLRQSGTYSLIAKAADEMELPPQRLKIHVTLDCKPQVNWVQPQEQWEVTPTTEVTLAIAAEDDLGVHKAGIAFQVGSGKLQTLWETDTKGIEQSLAAVAALLLEDRSLTHRDSVTYHAFAEDNYFGKPRRTITPLRFIDIRPYQQDFQLVEGGGACKGNSVTLEELIKRQREQLMQSFAAQDQVPLASPAAKKLAAAQTELLDQTIEFTSGLAELGGPVLPLEEACRQMEGAVNALEPGDLVTAVPAQQQALAHLIMARENLRKKLSQSSSSAACRKFDREQKQKLRLPEQKKQEQQQQLAKHKKQLEELAKRERQWSQQASQACQNPASGASPKPGEPSQPSKEEVTKSQAQMQKELAEIQEQLAKNDLAGKTAQEQAARAAESMEQGQQELEQNKGEAASKQGEQAADRLDQLAAHLAAMNQKDFGQRLNQAQQSAAKLAAEQEQLAGKVGGDKPGDKPGDKAGEGKAGDKPGEGQTGEGTSSAELAARQQDLAQQAKMLAEVLERLRQDAKGEKGQAANSLERIAAEQKPGEIALGMERTAGDLKAGNKPGAKAGAEQARDELAQLAQALGAAKGQLSQPQLQELMKLEEQLAKLREQAEKGVGQKPGEGNKPGDGSGGQAPGTAEKWDELQERLHELAESDKRLTAALRKLGGDQPLKPDDKLRPMEFQANSKQEVPPGFYSWDQLGDYQGLGEVAKALQTKIQEAILAGALQDSDEPVPLEYKALVEKYYRTLSDDLR